MFSSIPSAVLLGARGHRVAVEVHVAKGLPGFHVVGLPDDSIREARDRVRAAVMSAGAVWPDIKVTVNLAPSMQRKSGSGLDLAIAVGVLASSGQIPLAAIEGLAFFGELGLDGSTRDVPGAAPMAGVLGELDLVVPVANAVEASMISAGRVRAVGHLGELVSVLANAAPWPNHDVVADAAAPAPTADLADVIGQPVARYALEIAAAGGHHLLFVGPPGAGKTMLAARLPGLLPDLDPAEALEATMIHSAAGLPLPGGGLVMRPPFRAPHHTSSEVAMVGGGSHSLRPGEVSLAHRGVLFMDELPEFAPRVMDTLRQPLESGEVRVSRAALHVTIPSRFQLVAAMNPCPCGEGNRPGYCECGDARMRKYVSRISGPLIDRFDLRVGVEPPDVDELLSHHRNEATSVVAARVAGARRRALQRQGHLNAELDAAGLDEVAPLSSGALRLLRNQLEAGKLSARGYHRVRRVARTIVDLAAARTATSAAPTELDEPDVALALSMRTALRRSAGISPRVA